MAVLTGCASTRSPLERFEYSRLLMGVEARVTLYARDEASAIDAARAAFERIAELEAVMSDYRADSELSLLCDRAGAGPVDVSEDLFRVLEVAEGVSELTDGAFDVTVKPLVDLWRESRETKRLPDPERLDAARALVGWRRVHLDREHRTVALEPGTRLDLGGIGKGYACDEALTVVRDRGTTRAMIQMGGDVALGDAPPGREGWEVALASNDTGDRGRRRRLSNTSIASSGDAEQFVDIDGVRYSHIVDPRTGLGSTRHVEVHITASRGAIADAWATATAVMGVGPDDSSGR